MHIVNIYDAKTHFSQLIERVLKGEEIVVAKAGKPVVRLVAQKKIMHKRTPGYWRGKIKTS